MKRLQLSDEEVRHIEQRRDNEKRFALGYNQAIKDAQTRLLDWDNGEAISQELVNLLKVIR